jgi:hypothetical protein
MRDHYVDDIDDYEPPKALVLRHRPFRRPRNGFVGECMFSSAWTRLMQSPPVEDEDNPRGQATKLESILRIYPHEIGERQASIAASFALWLGTNGGRSFLSSAKELGEKLSSARYGYLSAWAIENERVSNINYNVRTIEAILREEDFGQSQDLFSTRRPNVQILSAADIEVVDTIVVWLATEEGMTFVNTCLDDLENLRRAQQDEVVALRRADNAKRTITGESTYAR